jgi:hypothetical protein
MSTKTTRRYCCKCGKELEDANERKCYLLIPRRWVCNDCYASKILKSGLRARIADIFRGVLGWLLLVSPLFLYTVSEKVFRRSDVSLTIGIAALVLLGTIDKIFPDRSERIKHLREAEQDKDERKERA